MITVDTEEERQLIMDAFIEAKVSIRMSKETGRTLSPYEVELFSRLTNFLENIKIKVKTKRNKHTKK